MTFLERFKNFIHSNSAAIKITLIYSIIGAGWIIFSDLFVLNLSGRNLIVYNHFQQLKGILFIIITSIILYGLISKYFNKINETNRKLVVNEERYKNFLQQSMEGIFRIEISPSLIINDDPVKQINNLKQNLYLAECNDAFSRYFGLSRSSDLIGFKYSDFERNYRNDFDQLLKVFIENNYYLNEFETSKVNQNGIIQYFKNNLIGIIENERLTRVWGITRDISELKKTELALAESEELYRTVVQSLTEGLLITDVDDKILFASNSMTNITGYDNSELVGQIGYKLFFETSDWDFILNKNKNRYKDLVEFYEIELKRKDNKKIWVSIHGAPYRNNKGEIIGTVGLIKDITETKKAERLIKESEEKYRSVVNSVREVIFQTDTSGNITFVNPFFEEITGYTSREVIGSELTDYIFEDDRKSIIDRFISLIYKKKEYLREECRLIAKDKTIRWIEINAKLSFNNQNEIKGISGTVSDIHDRKIASEELIIAKEKAEESDKLKSTFLAQVSHEIRTPLNIILSYNSLIKEEIKDYLNRDLEESFESIEKGGNRLLRTIDLILNMSMIQTGSYKTRFEKLDLALLLKQLIKEFKYLAEEKHIDVILNINSENTLVNGDEYTIIQAFQNLLDNAVKFTEQGEVAVTINELSNNNLAVEIKDTGIGIDEKYLPEVFEPFTQEETGYSRKYEGNGLGLALTKKYLELNNAQIQVNSVKGKGTKFTIIFK